MENIEKIKPEKSLPEMAEELFALQAVENNGRGISCVQDVVTYLRMGKKLEAMAVASTDHDKIHNYPEVEAYLKTHLFNGEDLHGWSPSG